MTYPCDPPKSADEGSEHEIQSAFVKSIAVIAPDVKVAAFCNASTKLGGAMQGKLKREGRSAGVPDVLVTWGYGVGFSPVPDMAFIEFKARQGSLSDEQKGWLSFLHDRGFKVAVCRSARSAVEFLRKSGAPIRGEIA